MKVLFRKINPAAEIPTYAHPGDAGMDLKSVESLVLVPGARALVHTGLMVELPADAEAQIRPRSGLALKYGVTVLNAPGTIDAGYRGEIGVVLINLGQESFVVEQGMKIAQMVIAPIVQVESVVVDELSSSVRGAGGFGSTGI